MGWGNPIVAMSIAWSAAVTQSPEAKCIAASESTPQRLDRRQDNRAISGSNPTTTSRNTAAAVSGPQSMVVTRPHEAEPRHQPRASRKTAAVAMPIARSATVTQSPAAENTAVAVSRTQSITKTYTRQRPSSCHEHRTKR